jgi:hypothetical protein
MSMYEAPQGAELESGGLGHQVGTKSRWAAHGPLGLVGSRAGMYYGTDAAMNVLVANEASCTYTGTASQIYGYSSF